MFHSDRKGFQSDIIINYESMHWKRPRIILFTVLGSFWETDSLIY